MTSMKVKNGWKEVKLGDFSKVISGYAFKKNDFLDNGVGIIKIKNIRSGYIDISTIDRVSSQFLELDEKYHVKDNDILLSLTGSHITQPNSVVGRIALAKTYEPLLLNQRAGKIIFKNKNVNKFFVYFVLSQFKYTQKIAGMAHGAASQANVSPSQVESLEIELPPLSTQQKIASILSAFDDLIENNTKRIKILEKTAQLIYKEWFVDFKFPSFAKASAGRPNHEKVKMVESGTEFGKIPEGWEVKELKDFGEVVTGKTPSKKVPENFGNDVPFIKTPDMHGEMFIIETNESLSLEGVKTQKKKTLPEDSLIVSCIGSVGVVAITSEDSQTNQQINAVVLNDKNLREYLYIVFLGLKPTLEGLGSSGATMCNVNKQKFESIKLLRPSQEILEEYHRIIAPMFNETLALQHQKLQLQETRDLLLPKLVSGEVGVDNLDI